MEENPDFLNEDIRGIITRQFFTTVEELEAVLKPVKEAIKYLERKNTSLADCFWQLIKLAVFVRSLSDSFRQQCISIFNKRWIQADINLYMLAYLLHPLYHGIYIYFFLS